MNKSFAIIRPMLRMGALLLPIACCLFFTGCSYLTPPPSTLRPASAITSSLQKRSENLQTLRGSAQIKATFKHGREITGRAAVIVKRPDRFRLEIAGPFNQTAFIVIYNGKNLSLFSFQENKSYMDYPLPVEASRLPHYLLGLPSSEVRSLPPSVFIGGQGSENEQVLIDQDGNIREIILSMADGAAVKISIDSYKEIDGLIFPFVISIKNNAADIFIKYDDIELNRHIPDDLFNYPSFP